MAKPDWKGQNIPCDIKDADGTSVSILPVLRCFLEYDDESILDLLPSVNYYGWENDLLNNVAWANNSYKYIYFIPDFSRYGGLPRWFPTTDHKNRRLTNQGQVDRFLFLLDLAYGGLPKNHCDVNHFYLAEAILELADNLGIYIDIEEGDNVEWELAEPTNDD